MSALKSSLQSLAASFAEDVVRAIQGASLQELLGEVATSRARRGGGAAVTGDGEGARALRSPALGRKGRLKRRSADDIAAALDRIVALLKQRPGGLRAEQIRTELNMLAKELPRPLAEGLASKSLRKKGQKRATVYFAAGTPGPAAEAPAPRVTRKK
jgi:hypothetical protein